MKADIDVLLLCDVVKGVFGCDVYGVENVDGTGELLVVVLARSLSDLGWCR